MIPKDVQVLATERDKVSKNFSSPHKNEIEVRNKYPCDVKYPKNLS